MCDLVSTVGWRRGIVVGGVQHTSEVTIRRAWLVLGWMTVWAGTPSRSAQPGSLSQVPALLG